MTKHFVTGAAGFLGRHIVEKLCQEGETDIIAFDILTCGYTFNGVTYVQGTVLNRELLLELTRTVDYIYHTAALVPLTKSGEGFYNVNVVGTRNIVECCKLNDVQKLVHISSSAIYGLPNDMPITDKTGYAPIEIYGQSKLDAEREVWRYREEGGRAHRGYATRTCC